MTKILFLAQFAPTDGVLKQKPKTKEEHFYYETYHMKVIESLTLFNYNFYSTCDVQHLFDFHSDYDLVWSLYNRLGFRNSEIFVQSLCEYFGIWNKVHWGSTEHPCSS